MKGYVVLVSHQPEVRVEIEAHTLAFTAAKAIAAALAEVYLPQDTQVLEAPSMGLRERYYAEEVRAVRVRSGTRSKKRS